MAISTLTTFNDLVNTEVISRLILTEAREQTFMPSLVYNEDVEGSGSLTANFARFASIAAAGLTETADMDSTTASTDQAGAITASEVGIRVDVSDKMLRTSSRISVEDLVALCGRSLAAKIETDLCAVFASASTSVGSTGVDLSLTNIEDAIYNLKVNQAAVGNPTLPGTPQALTVAQCVLHTRQMADLRAAMRSANFAFVGPEQMGIVLNSGSFGSGMAGSFWGVTFWESTKPATANNGDDRVGALFVPRAIGFVTAGGPKLELQRDASFRSTEVNLVQIYGAGEVADSDYVKIVTDA